MLLGDLAKALDLELHGDANCAITRLAPIETATADELAFVVGAKFRSALIHSAAGAVILPAALSASAPRNCLISEDPYVSYARASWLLKPWANPAPGVHASAIVHPTAKIAKTAHVGAGVVIGEQTIVGEEAVIEAHCVLGRRVSIGDQCQLFARVTVYDDVLLGECCRIQSGAVLGSEGFGYAWQRAAETPGWQQIQQTGGVRLGNAVHVGANTTIDCGAIDATVIGNGVILDNQIQIAHNVCIGDYTAIAGCTGIAGSTHIGSHCQIGGACNIVGHLRIADRVVINAASLVTRSIDQPGRYGSGMPLQPEREWRRSFVTLGRLDSLFKRVRRLERTLADD